MCFIALYRRGPGLGWKWYHAPYQELEVKLKFWALIWKEKGNFHIVYDCIQMVTISAVGECAERKKPFQKKAYSEIKRSRRRTAPNDLNYALPCLIIGQIKKKKLQILSSQTRSQFRQKTISRYLCPFKRCPSSWDITLEG